MDYSLPYFLPHLLNEFFRRIIRKCETNSSHLIMQRSYQKDCTGNNLKLKFPKLTFRVSKISTGGNEFLEVLDIWKEQQNFSKYLAIISSPLTSIGSSKRVRLTYQVSDILRRHVECCQVQNSYHHFRERHHSLSGIYFQFLINRNFFT